VRQVRELAYDVEDCIEFVVHLDTKTSKTNWFWRMIPSWCIAPPPTALALDKAVSEIEQLKAQVKDVSTRNSRYSLISDSGSKPVTQHHAAMAGTTALSSTELNMLAEARDAARRQQGLGDITHLITNKDNQDPHLQVISVWGTGSDLGTTSIIRKAYSDPEICKKFLCRAWVKLMHPFNPNEFVRRFMAQVYKNSCEEQGVDVGVHVLTKMKAEQGDLLKEFVKEVKTKTYLVVLENLTDMVDWDDVRTFLPDMMNGSWIIVSTQQFEIASLCIGDSYQPLELQQFSPEHSVCAFFKEVKQAIININYVLLEIFIFRNYFAILFRRFKDGHINVSHTYTFDHMSMSFNQNILMCIKTSRKKTTHSIFYLTSLVMYWLS
jgi:hypothetical protein